MTDIGQAKTSLINFLADRFGQLTTGNMGDFLSSVKINGEPIDSSRVGAMMTEGFTGPAAMLQMLLDKTGIGKGAEAVGSMMGTNMMGTVLGGGSQSVKDAIHNFDLVDYLDVLEGNYCDPASMIQPEQVPAMWYGPSAAFKVDTGSCKVVTKSVPTLLGDGDETEVFLKCSKPSITISKEKAEFVSQHTTPVIFKYKSCVLDKTFGDDMTEVLHVFGQEPTSWAALNQKIVDRVTEAVVGKQDWLAGLFQKKTLTDLGGSMPGTSMIGTLLGGM